MSGRILASILLSACLFMGGGEAAAQCDTVSLLFIGDVMSHGPQVTASLKPGGDRDNPADFDYSACFRHLKGRFDAADFVVAFIEQLKHTKGEFYDKPFELIDWQEQIIRDVFGVLKADGYRQFNTVYIEVPKKCGKSASPSGKNSHSKNICSNIWNKASTKRRP